MHANWEKGDDFMPKQLKVQGLSKSKTRTLPYVEEINSEGNYNIIGNGIKIVTLRIFQ